MDIFEPSQIYPQTLNVPAFRNFLSINVKLHEYAVLLLVCSIIMFAHCLLFSAESNTALETTGKCDDSSIINDAAIFVSMLDDSEDGEASAESDVKEIKQ